jgi:rhodanese-related sulfurtransferase
LQILSHFQPIQVDRFLQILTLLLFLPFDTCFTYYFLLKPFSKSITFRRKHYLLEYLTYTDLILDTVINGASLNILIQNNDSDLLIIDTRPFSDYVTRHIIGSINLDLMNFHWLDTSKEGILQFNHQMNILLNYLGVNSKKIVVFYDDISGSTASRGVWLLHYFSHKNVFLLDGGFKSWLN